jgi:predicted pyridoxine 5'-phosphate oxidase superfamily flavin-nucleotide-binding protein
MTGFTSDVGFTPAVKRMQSAKGSRDGYARMEKKGGWRDTVTGGKPGFLKVLDERSLAFADFRGNKQYITAGNLSENDKAYIFLMDYPNRRRIKLWGRARVSDDKALLADLFDADYKATPEQAVIFEIAAWDVNCPQHITPRYTETQVAEIVERLTQRVAELEAKLAEPQ